MEHQAHFLAYRPCLYLLILSTRSQNLLNIHSDDPFDMLTLPLKWEALYAPFSNIMEPFSFALYLLPVPSFIPLSN